MFRHCKTCLDSLGMFRCLVSLLRNRDADRELVQFSCAAVSSYWEQRSRACYLLRYQRARFDPCCGSSVNIPVLCVSCVVQPLLMDHVVDPDMSEDEDEDDEEEEEEEEDEEEEASASGSADEEDEGGPS